MDELAKRIAAISHDFPFVLLESLAHDLLAFNSPSDQGKAIGRLPNGNLRQSIGEILAIADQQGLSTESVVLAIKSAFHSHRNWRESLSIEMVWTGPSPPSTSLRRTDQALLEVINKAAKSLWIVSFAAYRVKSIIDSINKAVLRGADVTLILESSEESEGKLSTDQINEIRLELSNRCKFFIWPTEKREPNSYGSRGLLHAKCALADSEYLFVSSANLTQAAHRRNIELGVLMKNGKNATQIERHLTWLIESKTLERL